MMAGTPPDVALSERITRRGRALIVIWAAGILVLYGAAALSGVLRLREYRTRAWNRVESSVGSPAREAGPGDAGGAAAGAPPIEVRIGAHIHRIRELSIASASWKADFDIWFRWRGDTVDPGKHFEIVNGAIESRELLASFVQDGERYERYRVQARILTQFDTSRSPFGRGVLGVQIEDTRDDADRLRDGSPNDCRWAPEKPS